MHSWHSCLCFFDRGAEYCYRYDARAALSPSADTRASTRAGTDNTITWHAENLSMCWRKKKWRNAIRQLRGSCDLTKLPSETFESSAVDTLLKHPSPAECHILYPIHKLRGEATTKGLATRVEETCRWSCRFPARLLLSQERGNDNSGSLELSKTGSCPDLSEVTYHSASARGAKEIEERAHSHLITGAK